MRVLISGGTGFIGQHLCRVLLNKGAEVICLTRNAHKAGAVLGQQVECIESLNEIASTDKIDSIINLAGASIAGFPWTKSRRKVLLNSRLNITQALVELMERLETKPKVFVSGSAIGVYGIDSLGNESKDRTEASEPGDIFQAQLCRQWEECARGAESLGVRVCYLRTGIVLGKNGGALPQLARPVKMFVGSVMGSGKQWMSWVHINDLVQLIVMLLENEKMQGPVNATTPEPVTHKMFMKTLARVLGRPVLFWIPAFPLRALLGEMAQLFVDGQRVVPQYALQEGFVFEYTDLKEALQAAL